MKRGCLKDLLFIILKKNPHSTIKFFSLNPFKKWVFKKVFIFQNFFWTMPDMNYERFKGLVTTTQSFSKTQNQNICLDESYEHLLCIKHVINFSVQSISSIFYASMSSIFYACMSKQWALAQNIFLMNDYWHACGKNLL